MGNLEDSVAPLPLGSRMEELLSAAITDLEDYRAPLNEAFLMAHEVTLDEAYTLADHLRYALIAYRKVPGRMVAMALGEFMAEEAFAEAPAEVAP